MQVSKKVIHFFYRSKEIIFLAARREHRDADIHLGRTRALFATAFRSGWAFNGSCLILADLLVEIASLTDPHG